MGKIRKAHSFKGVQFQADADQAMRFFDGPYNWLYSGQHSQSSAFQMGSEYSVPRPTFRMTMNKAAEVVQLYGPSLYARNPHRQVSLRRQSEYPMDLIQDPQQQQMMAQQLQMRQRIKEVSAGLMEELLNYSPNELDLRGHSRRAIDEALIIGMGLLWTELYQPPGSPYSFIGSFYDTTDNLLVDPDMESIRDAKWISRRCVHPKWEVAEKYDVPEDEMRGGLESANMQAVIESGGPEYQYFRQTGETNDLVVYFKVYSRMGLGHLMRGEMAREMEFSKEVLDGLGKYVYLVVSDNHPYPLNLPEEVLKRGDMDEIRQRVSWPTPYYLDPTDPWPFSYLAFHERPRKVWPMSHLKPGMGELSFLNWAFSFLADKVKNTSRDFVATARSLDEETKANLLGGRDLTLLEFEKIQGGSISDVIQFLQHPPFNKDIIQVTEMLMQIFEERVGLNELMYGQSRRQLRSAAEANVKSDAMRIRPDDMAECVEAWSTLIARKEAIATYWHLTPRDVTPILGPERAELYANTVMQQDVHTIIHEFDIRIEAGSVRKPNRDKDLANVNHAIQVWGPVVQAYAQMTGDFEPLNFLANQWEKVNDMEPRGIRFNPPPPPQPDESAMQQAQIELQMKQQEHEQKLAQDQEQHQVKLQQQVEGSMLKLELDRLRGVQGSRQDEDSHVQDVTQDEEKHVQELSQDQQRHLQEMMQARQEGRLALFLKEKMAKTQPAPSENGGNGRDRGSEG